MDDPSDSWMTADGPSLREGNRNLNVDAADAGADGQRGAGEGLRSFEWRGGSERMTTGIWMWSEPFVLRTEGGKDVAVLLVDTQGMFDNETSMGLTACIFAVSTLVSEIAGEGAIGQKNKVRFFSCILVVHRSLE